MFFHNTNKQYRQIMAALADLTAAVTRISTALAAVGTKVGSLEATIASSISPGDSDTLLSGLTTIAVGLEALAPVTP